MMCAKLNSIFDPSSLLYGAISLFASLGTIYALYLTIRSTNDNKAVNRAMAQARALDRIFSEFDYILKQLHVSRSTANGRESYVGREAILQSKKDLALYFLQRDGNLDAIENYLKTVPIYSTAAGVILMQMSSFEKPLLENRINREFLFVKKHLLPCLIEANNIAKSQNNPLIDKTAELVTSATAISEMRMKDGQIF